MQRTSGSSLPAPRPRHGASVGGESLGISSGTRPRARRRVMDWGARARQALRSLAGQRISKKIEMRVIALTRPRGAASVR